MTVHFWADKMKRKKVGGTVNEVNKTLYISLYGKAYVTEKGILLHDPKAKEIWAALF